MPAAASAASSSPTVGYQARELVIAGLLVALALLALYAVFLDQGALLSTLLGDSSYSSNFLHELAHDGRHLLGLPCH